MVRKTLLQTCESSPAGVCRRYSRFCVGRADKLGMTPMENSEHRSGCEHNTNRNLRLHSFVSTPLDTGNPQTG